MKYSILDLLLLDEQGNGQRTISKRLGIARSTVQRVLGRKHKLPEDWRDKTDSELEEIIFPKTAVSSGRAEIDFEYIHSELAKHHNLTLTMLWNEYCISCRNEGSSPYMYSRFAQKYRDYALVNKATMPLHRKPGVCEVDWSGDKGRFRDPWTMNDTEVHVFVGVLPYSQFFYVEGFLDERLENWITAHINMFRFFGGVPHTIISDNLKTGVSKGDKYETELHRNYEELGLYYGAAIIPARVREPHDKPSAEMSVNLVQQKILNAMRNEDVFSLDEWNSKASEILDSLLDEGFQKRDEGRSRRDIFESEELSSMLALPVRDFEIYESVERKVQMNYHVSIRRQYFSVPYKFVGKTVRVKYSDRCVCVYYHGESIAKHEGFRWIENSYVTEDSHMPENHRFVAGWSKEKMLSWASKIGPETYDAVNAVFSQRTHEEQAYKSVLGILSLAKSKPKAVEFACRTANSLPGRISYKTIKRLMPSEEPSDSHDDANDYSGRSTAPKGFLRYSEEESNEQ